MVHGSLLFCGLFNNLAIFIVLITAYSYLHRFFASHRPLYRHIIMGLVFAAAAIACMQLKIPIYEGVVFDQRNAVIILSGVFGGPVVSLICVILAAIYRIYLGGTGTLGGILTMILAVVAGIVFYYKRNNINTVLKAALAAMASVFFILPGFLFIKDFQTGIEIIKETAIPYGSAIFMGVFLSGLLMSFEEHRFKMKKELEASEKRYRDLFENLIDLGFRTDREGKVIIITPSCEKMLGFSPEELLGKSINDFCKESDSDKPLLSIVCRSGNISNFETEFKKKNGSHVWVSVNARTYLSEGEFSGIEGLVRDISLIKDALKEKNALQERIKHIQKMESIGTLAGGIAHDFNNTLAGIIGGAELLRDNDLTDQQHNQYVDLILTSAEKASVLTKKLLTFSRKGSTVIKPIDLIPILSDTVSILRHTIDKKVNISEDFHLNSAWIQGDGSLLQNAFLNLGINAGHAMPSGGNLIFAARTVELDSRYCELSTFNISAGTFVEITVSDTGQGMTPEVMSRIFEPFFTTKEHDMGTGLGLSAVYGTVAEHHGAITVYSEVGKGTVFHVYLPMSDQHVQQPIIEPVVPQGSGTILLVDDEELVQATASTILTKLGYRVITAENGKRGIELYKEHRKEINLVILDMIMPVMGGKETFMSIHSIDPSLPVIISSGFSREEDQEALSRIGVSGFLRKPFHRVELAEMISKLLFLSVEHTNNSDSPE
ncbi:MAG: response regulator [Fibrobacter sp.]|nr:response regulator [Fibrobacter sp.]